MKICSKCKLEQDYSMFAKNAGRKDGHYPQCKLCTKAWREANKEALLQQKREYYQANIEKMPERNRAKYVKHGDKQKAQQAVYYSDPINWIKRMIAKAQVRAEQVGLEFDISRDDVLVPTHCPYLGVELTFKLGGGQLPTNASLDRIDSSKGYVKGNVQVVCRKANTMKSNATDEELLKFAQSIMERHANNTRRSTKEAGVHLQACLVCRTSA